MFNVFHTEEIKYQKWEKEEKNGIQTKKPNLIIRQMNSRTTLRGKD